MTGPNAIDIDMVGDDAAAALRSGQLVLMRAHRPLIPAESCPMIDRAAKRAAAAMSRGIALQDKLAGVRGARAMGAHDLAAQLIEELCILEGFLEEIRTANDQLRRSSYYWRRAADEIEKGKE